MPPQFSPPRGKLGFRVQGSTRLDPLLPPKYKTPFSLASLPSCLPSLLPPFSLTPLSRAQYLIHSTKIFDAQPSSFCVYLSKWHTVCLHYAYMPLCLHSIHVRMRAAYTGVRYLTLSLSLSLLHTHTQDGPSLLLYNLHRLPITFNRCVYRRVLCRRQHTAAYGSIRHTPPSAPVARQGSGAT